MYQEVTSMKHLYNTVEMCLEEYNQTHKTRMNLVIFRYCASRRCRYLFWHLALELFYLEFILALGLRIDFCAVIIYVMFSVHFNDEPAASISALVRSLKFLAFFRVTQLKQCVKINETSINPVDVTPAKRFLRYSFSL